MSEAASFHEITGFWKFSFLLISTVFPHFALASYAGLDVLK